MVVVVTDAADALPPAIFDEMARQYEDARRSFAENGEMAGRIAEAVRRSGRLMLLGMGGSHAVNRVVEGLYRQAGIDATAVIASEAFSMPFPGRGTVVLLTSQSGDSGEIVAYLGRPAEEETRFGLTLTPEGTLAKSIPSLIGHGGMERAFAATRSLYVSLTMHARVLHQLGIPHDRVVEAATRRQPPPFEPAVAAMAAVDAVIFTGRGPMQGIAEAVALGLLELARMPSLALEGGQLRHGPVEALGPRLGIAFVRQADVPADSSASLVRVCVDGGSPTVVFDLSGEAPVDGAVTIAFPRSSGIEAALTALPTLQRFIFEMARSRVGTVGEPVRSSKVTRET
jgi:fructoselysine-6-P-deglycase FrlB-like protein